MHEPDCPALLLVSHMFIHVLDGPKDVVICNVVQFNVLYCKSMVAVCQLEPLDHLCLSLVQPFTRPSTLMGTLSAKHTGIPQPSARSTLH